MTDVLLLLADGSAAVAPVTSAAAGGASWLSPDGLDALLAILAPLALLLGRLLGKAAEAKKAADYLTLARAYTAQVRGVQSWRELVTPEHARQLLGAIESETAQAGVAAQHHAAVHAITEGAAPMPAVAPGVVEKVATHDPIAAVRAATARIARRVA